MVSFLHDAGTGQGVAPQIDPAYSAIVRSLENFPERATLRIALRPHASRSRVEVGHALLRRDVRRQVGQVHVVVALRQQRVADRLEEARLVGG